ncbi:alpha/beta fold hydrolase [Paenibacillus senegalensis]|uniref:alpha/beta fold hydrolase n=1 Tax=Paenibacillus senegalensis TaxID=1465766 RepID=UPI0002894BC4|nr:alpha/beta hydrolase [Paenibacillus senegalensis]
MIHQIRKVMLGGTYQWFTIRGRHADLPLLLFLHGGPGSPQAGALRKFNRELEEHYLVVNWDQRGSGKSYNAQIPPDTMNIAQLLSDAHQLVQLLLNEHSRHKVFIVGHSMGALLGMLYVHQHPEFVQAFVGINQPVNRSEEETLSYSYCLQKARDKDLRKAILQLERIGPPNHGSYSSMDDLVIQRKWLTRFGGVTHKKNALSINIHCLLSSHFSWKDRLNFMKGFTYTMQHMWQEFNHVNLFEAVSAVEVPLVFIKGCHDKIVHDFIDPYCRSISAPYKEIVQFDQSGHLACFEEPELFNQLMVKRVRELA